MVMQKTPAGKPVKASAKKGGKTATKKVCWTVSLGRHCETNRSTRPVHHQLQPAFQRQDLRRRRFPEVPH